MRIILAAGVDDMLAFVARRCQRHAGKHRSFQVVTRHNDTQLLTCMPKHACRPDRNLDGDDLAGTQTFFGGIGQKGLVRSGPGPDTHTRQIIDI